jgi:TRAP-type C4-dicarboxylate transport system permease small subunit
MRLITRVTDLMMLGLALIGGLGILMLMAHVVIDVALRNLSNRPVPATYEIVTNYYMIVLAFVPLAWVERRGGMVAVEVADGLLPRSVLRASDISVALFSTAVYGALFWVSWTAAATNTATGTFVMTLGTRIPTWPAFWLLPAGFLLAALVTLLRAVTLATSGPARA